MAEPLPSEADFSQTEVSLSSQSGLIESQLSSLSVPCVLSGKPATSSQGKTRGPQLLRLMVTEGHCIWMAMILIRKATTAKS